MWEVAFYIVVIALAYIAASTVGKAQQPIAATLEDIKAPVAEEGKEIPVTFGTRDISDANVIWYGDLRTVPMESGGGK